VTQIFNSRFVLGAALCPTIFLGWKRSNLLLLKLFSLSYSVPSSSPKVSMRFLWNSYRNSMIFLDDFYAISIGFL
jgi:hypothetical protein